MSFDSVFGKGKSLFSNLNKFATKNINTAYNENYLILEKRYEELYSFKKKNYDFIDKLAKLRNVVLEHMNMKSYYVLS